MAGTEYRVADGMKRIVRVAHDTRHITAWRPWVARILAKHVQHITEVETHGTHP
jgi:hypothetical protein